MGECDCRAAGRDELRRQLAEAYEELARVARRVIELESLRRGGESRQNPRAGQALGTASGAGTEADGGEHGA